ncbi:MAG TPA: cytochrome D1 domain-containing protein, partial [Casimicrobiaceae bacterium]|nr:cytochrome D1 domain-containing protein [Casimicrobiaceae bacterium]
MDNAPGETSTMFLARMMLASLALAAHVAYGAVQAYASNEGSGSVSVIDTGSDEVTATIDTGGKPRGIAAAHDAKRLYVSDQAANGLVVIDLAKNAVAQRAPLGKSPEGIYLSHDGRFLSAAIEENNQVAIVDTSSLAIVKRVTMRGKNPEHAVWSPDGK